MNTSSINPFSPSDLQKLNKLLQDCHDTQCVIDKLRKTGLDVSELESANAGHKQFATVAKAEFFPNEE